jgi:branched-chain amino acid transport system substrate-binding protein
MRKPAFSLLVLTAVAAGAALPGAHAGPSAPVVDPGITATSILLGGTSPLTGPAVAYASVARGAKAYFDSVNAKGGVARRSIEYKILDDAYNPAQTVQATRQLVEQDKVFAIFNTLGTEVNLSIRDYLNGSKVPQLFAASGATTFGRDAPTYPWTIGFQPSYQAEGWVLGRYLAKTKKHGKIAVLFQNDEYGKDLLGGLKRGLRRSGVKVVAAQAYEVTALDVSSQIAKLKASRAGTFAIFATPTFAIQSFVYANKLGWKPEVINNAVSAASNIMLLASEGGKNKTVDGTVALNFLKDPSDIRWKKDPGMRTYRAVMSRFAKGENANDVYHVYGMAVAYETVSLFKRLGANPTRAGLMAKARTMNDPSNPFLLPGIAVETGQGDGFPIQQGQLQRWTNGRWVPFGAIWTSKKL